MRFSIAIFMKNWLSELWWLFLWWYSNRNVSRFKWILRTDPALSFLNKKWPKSSLSTFIATACKLELDLNNCLWCCYYCYCFMRKMLLWVFAEFMLVSCELKLSLFLFKRNTCSNKNWFSKNGLGMNCSSIKFLLFGNRGIQWLIK